MPGTIQINLGVLLEDYGMTLVELSRRTGISTVNLSLLKNGHARAMRFSTLIAICDALECTPGELICYHPLAIAS